MKYLKRLLVLLMWVGLPFVFVGCIPFMIPLLVCVYLACGIWATPKKVMGTYTDWLFAAEAWADR